MPTTSRGFWACDFCQLKFDRFEEAQYHEVEDCLRNHRSTASADARAGVGRYSSPSAAAAAVAPATGTGPPAASAATAISNRAAPPPLEYSPHHHTNHPPPLQHQHLHYQQRGHQHQSQQTPHHPYPIMPPYSPPPPPPGMVGGAGGGRYSPAVPHPPGAAGSPYDHQRQQQQQQPVPSSVPSTPRLRRFPLLQQHQRANVAEADATACRNLELFETRDGRRGPGGSGGDGGRTQVGLRCVACAVARMNDSSLSPAEREGREGGASDSDDFSLPRTTASVAEAVRQMADRHLSRCTNVPTEIRRAIAAATDRRAASEEDGGPSWHEEESDRRMLADHCEARCQQLGIVNGQPENSGIVFQDVASPSGREGPPRFAERQGAPPQQQQPASYPYESAGPPHYYYPPTSAQTPPPHGYRPPPPPPGYAAGFPGDSSAPYGAADDSRTSGGNGAGGIDQDSAAQQPIPLAAPADAPPGYYRNPPPTYDLPSNFPFFQDPIDGDWMCKYCSHIHPHYRDSHYRWSIPAKTPPPGDFIDHHLSMCRCYHDGGTVEYHHQGPPTPTYSRHQSQQMTLSPPQAAWESTPVGRGAPGSSGMMTPMMPSELVSAPYQRSSPSPSLAQQTFSPALLREPDDLEAAARHAIEFLTANDRSLVEADGSATPDEDHLVREDDKLLLTDFLFYLMKQLRLVRFSEADRKTRGGKREKIQVGFGGLQCVHCAHIPKSRKFFWSGVDRLANSFAEIPAHVFKCKHCSDEVKDALNALKRIHPEQMARLPRGSQKVFFRRVWKRLHDKDPPATPAVGSPDELKPAPPGSAESSSGAQQQQQQPSPPEGKQQSPSGTSGSDESMFMLERPTKEAAKALADSAMQSAPPSPSSRVLLAIPEDKDFLSDTDCFIRKQLEVFCATTDDVRIARDDRKFPIKAGQVGLRCVHCSLSKDGRAASGHAVTYPFSIGGIFETVREFQRLHLEYCENLPPAVRSKLSNLRESTTISSIQRKYYVLAARGLGLRDTKESGIRAGSESVPVVAQAVFAFTEDSTGISEEIAGLQGDEAITPPAAASRAYSSPYDPSSRKREPERGDADSPDKKKPTPDPRVNEL